MKLKQQMIIGSIAVTIIVLIAAFIGIASSSSMKRSMADTQKYLEESCFLDQKLNDHYVWMQGLTDQFLVDIEFDNQLDPTKCGFGTWYYEFIKSDEYGSLPDDIKKIIDAMETPHKELHEHGHEIKESFSPIDLSLGEFLLQKKIDHLLWMDNLADTWHDDEHIFTGATNPRECSFGKWYYIFIDSDEFDILPSGLKNEFYYMEEHHVKLHQSADKILALAGPDKKISDPETKVKAETIYEKETHAEAEIMMGLFDEILSYIEAENQKKRDSIDIYKFEVLGNIENIRDKFQKYQDYISNNIDSANENAQKTKNFYSILLILTMVIGGVLAAGVGLFFSGMISKPLGKLEEVANKISKGDLNVKCGNDMLKRSDEIGVLTRTFSSMVQSLRDMTLNVSRNADDTASVAEELSASSEEVNASTQQVASTIQSVAKGGQNLSKIANESKHGADVLINSIKNVASSAQESVKNINLASDEAMKASKSAETAEIKMKNISEAVMSSSNIVKVLGEKTQEIGKVIEVINSISEQTNLLALNAAIEAARAGEAGKGFAVVADEVRKLAEESKNATKQIEDIINDVVENTQSTIISMEKGTKEVEEGSAVVTQALSSLQNISKAVVDIKAQIEMISVGTQAQITNSESFLKSMDEVSSVAEESAASSEEVSASSQQTTASMQNVANSAQQLAQSAEELKKLISQFKL